MEKENDLVDVLRDFMELQNLNKSDDSEITLKNYYVTIKKLKECFIWEVDQLYGGINNTSDGAIEIWDEAIGMAINNINSTK